MIWSGHSEAGTAIAGVRCAMALASAQLLPLHDSRPLSNTFNDLALYNGTVNQQLPLWGIPNPLYSVLVRLLGYGHSQLQDWRFVALCLMLNILFTAVFVITACRVMRPKHSLMYACILGAHPIWRCVPKARHIDVCALTSGLQRLLHSPTSGALGHCWPLG